ncbi:hypothetical protein HYH02_007776 [Chlamydomonas schloesseri]|uniref:Uncharacterized protein n=1 Tax=Chlamydomonas schloesseri TaxID=2026947 RepID=A0A835WHE9_9CHLO|nr:hypothetical protein HYH02_007776 [Chlamydomonas schloesseri]|eukprot:KAG2447452.1 hypothetical protein HYH02_007776 [Chlamydomonas schloesseri]
MGRLFLARIAASAEEDPKTAEAFLAHKQHKQPAEQGEGKPQWVDPVKPLTPEEERLWKEYSLNFARRLNKM